MKTLSNIIISVILFLIALGAFGKEVVVIRTCIPSEQTFPEKELNTDTIVIAGDSIVQRMSNELSTELNNSVFWKQFGISADSIASYAKSFIDKAIFRNKDYYSWNSSQVDFFVNNMCNYERFKDHLLSKYIKIRSFDGYRPSTYRYDIQFKFDQDSIVTYRSRQSSANAIGIVLDEQGKEHLSLWADSVVLSAFGIKQKQVDKGNDLLYNLCEKEMESLSAILSELEMDCYNEDMANLRKTFEVKYAYLGSNDLNNPFQPYHSIEYAHWHTINVRNNCIHRQINFDFITTNCKNHLQGIKEFQDEYISISDLFSETEWIEQILSNDTSAVLTILYYHIPKQTKIKALNIFQSLTDPLEQFYHGIDLSKAIPFMLRSTYGRSIYGFLLDNHTTVINEISAGRTPEAEKSEPLSKLISRLLNEVKESPFRIFLLDSKANIIRRYDKDGNITTTQYGN